MSDIQLHLSPEVLVKPSATILDGDQRIFKASFSIVKLLVG